MRLTHGVFWLRRHRDWLLLLVFLSLATAFALDLLVPGYAIAGLYLIPLLLAAFALRERLLVALVGVTCLALTILALVQQDRTNAQNLLLIGFGSLAGLGLIALGYLYNRFDALYQSESAAAARLESLTLQLHRLQEVSVLDSDRPLSELLDYIALQAQQLLGGDGCALLRHQPEREVLSREAAAGAGSGLAPATLEPAESDPVGQVVRERSPVAIPDLPAWRDGVQAPADWTRHFGACIAVPLEAAQDLFGVLVVLYRDPRPFGDDDVRFAQSFGANAALAIENGRLREQLERAAVAAERSRLGRDLHDSVSQALFAASIQAETLRSRWQPASEEARRSLDDVERLTRGALAEMRALLLEMRPGALAQTPLPDLLRHLTDSAEARSDLVIRRSVAELPTLPPDVTVALYRIAQEAMNNVVRHSRAKSAWLSLDCDDGFVTLTVGDDGRGFDSPAAGPQQFGLQIMEERAQAVGSTLDTASATGQGTVVTVRWSDGEEVGQ